jgi:hypothetical protein
LGLRKLRRNKQAECGDETAVLCHAYALLAQVVATIHRLLTNQPADLHIDT